MSKRPNEESREERWLRKIKMYEEKITAKRQRLDEEEQRQSVQQNEPPIAQGVQIEEHPECYEGNNRKPNESEDMISIANNVENNEYDRQDNAFNEESLMTTTTACSSPNSFFDGNGERVAEDEFDPQLLQELGAAETDPTEFGENLQADVASKFVKILQDGIKKEVKEELLKNYLFPKNVPLAKSPTLNPEIGAMLPEQCKQRDKRLLVKQDQQGKTLSALGKALTGLLKKTPDIPEVIRTLNDASMLLDSHYLETDTRRSVIIPLIDKSLSDPFKDRKRDSFLFGDKLGDLVKDSKSMKKTSQLLQPSSSNLNVRGPSFRGARRGQHRSGQAYPHRTGGPRAAIMAPPQDSYPNRRRAAVQQPPSAPRRYPAPPPPPRPARRPPPPPAQRPTTSR